MENTSPGANRVKKTTVDADKNEPKMIFKTAYFNSKARTIINENEIRDCRLFIEGTGLEIFTKRYFKKVLAASEEHNKKILAPYTTPAKTFVSCMLKKFLYLSGKVLLLLFEKLNFQKEVNSKRHTSFNEQSY